MHHPTESRLSPEVWGDYFTLHFNETYLGAYFHDNGKKAGLLFITDEDAYLNFQGSDRLEKGFVSNGRHHGSLLEFFSEGREPEEGRRRMENLINKFKSTGQRVDRLH